MRLTTLEQITTPLALPAWEACARTEYERHFEDTVKDIDPAALYICEPTQEKHREVYGGTRLFAELTFIRELVEPFWQRYQHDTSVLVIGTTESDYGRVFTHGLIEVPIYQIEIPNTGILTLFNDVNRWNVTCELTTSLRHDPWEGIYETTHIPRLLRNFPVLDSFNENRQNFSMTLPAEHMHLYAFMALLCCELQRTVSATV